LAADFCPKNLAFARKIMTLPESGGCSPSPQPSGSYAYGRQNYTHRSAGPIAKYEKKQRRSRSQQPISTDVNGSPRWKSFVSHVGAEAILQGY